MISLGNLSDRELMARVKQLAQEERGATALLVLHLAEVGERKLYLEEACASLYSYSTQVLHLSEAAAANRIVAARAGRRFPAILGALERGELHLAAVRLLAPLLTPENHHELIAAATHKSKREVAELVACIRPQPDVTARVRRLPAVKPANTRMSVNAMARAGVAGAVHAPATVAAPASESGSDIANALAGRPQTATPAPLVVAAAPSAGFALTSAPGAQTGRVDPLSPGRYKVQFTANAETYDSLCKARGLLRHRVPNGDLGVVMALAIDLLLQGLEKRKFGRTDRPQRRAQSRARARRAEPESRENPESEPGSTASDASRASMRQASRHVPAHVKRAVWRRDGGRCTFTSADGTRCTEKGRIEFDHRWPHADGGTPGIDNMRLLCRSHNQLEAQRFFGVWQAEGAAHG